MRTRETIAVGAVWMVGSLLFAGCLRNWDDYGGDLGDECESDDECASGVCAPDASGALVCARACAGSSGCIPGWTCGDDGTCSCAGGVESCNALDDDCDGVVDEGCGECMPSPESCNGIDDDCDGAVDEGACGECVPGPESCNGVDDDCDGLVDDGGALCGELDCWMGRCACVPRPRVDQVDLLLVVDNSNSMAEEQASLVGELPQLVRGLASGDANGDGLMDFWPPSSIHVGVVSTDMGTGGFPIPTCDRGLRGSRFGDDGILLSRGGAAVPGCMAEYPRVFDFTVGTTDPLQLANDVACVARLGTGGCGFEQQLEATLKALSPSTPQEWTTLGYQPPVFFGSTSGHAAGENAGFLRADSLLGVVILSDEEDCSVSNTEVFNTSGEFGGDLNLRCWMYDDAVTHQVERYIEGIDGRSGLLGLRQRADRLLFSVIAGVPVDAVPSPGSPDFAAVLAHPMMQNRLDPDAPATSPRLAPSCNVPGRGLAWPPRRMVRVAQGLDAQGALVSLGSICQDSYAGPFAAILEDVGYALRESPDCF